MLTPAGLSGAGGGRLTDIVTQQFPAGKKPFLPHLAILIFTFPGIFHPDTVQTGACAPKNKASHLLPPIFFLQRIQWVSCEKTSVPQRKHQPRGIAPCRSVLGGYTPTNMGRCPGKNILPHMVFASLVLFGCKPIIVLEQVLVKVITGGLAKFMYLHKYKATKLDRFHKPYKW